MESPSGSTQDTEAQDGIGLPGPPGHFGCGAERISASAAYLG
jgi:hypothetical protein